MIRQLFLGVIAAVMAISMASAQWEDTLRRAEQGDVVAQTSIGFVYARGDGVAQDYAEAVRWFRKAAEQGDALGQFELGFMHEEGYGVAQDYAEAQRLARAWQPTRNK